MVGVMFTECLSPISGILGYKDDIVQNYWSNALNLFSIIARRSKVHMLFKFGSRVIAIYVK